MPIENIVNGVSIECIDEGLDDVRNPAKVVIRDKKGKTITRNFCWKSRQWNRHRSTVSDEGSYRTVGPKQSRIQGDSTIQWKT